MYKRTSSKWLKHIDFIFLDVICIVVSFAYAFYLRHGNLTAIDDGRYGSIIFVAVTMHFCIAFFTNMYSGILRRGYYLEARKVLEHNAVLILFLLLYMFSTKMSGGISRIIIYSFFLIDCIVMYMVRIICKTYHRKKVDSARSHNLIIVTSYNFAKDSIRRLKNGPNKNYRIVGVALMKDEAPTIDTIDGYPIVARGVEVFEYACRNVVDSVFIRIEKANSTVHEAFANSFLEMGITVHMNVEMLAHGLPNAGFETINDVAVITSSINKPTHGGMIVKRMIDICAGMVGCIITGFLFITLGPAIKLSDPQGPVLFSQYRAGRNGRLFKIYKFRSMYNDAEERKKEYMVENKMDGLMFKLDADPRIIGSGPNGTKKGLGYFIRATSLDEFPNFYSILKGDMSLVGTRPPTLDEYEKYELHHKRRLALKPGLTGMWQISGRSDMTDFEEIVKLDSDYIKNWSISLDIKIIFKTIWVVLARRGSQ